MAITRRSRGEGSADVRNDDNLDTSQAEGGKARTRQSFHTSAPAKSDAKTREKQELLNKLLEGRQTREVQQRIAELVSVSPVLTLDKESPNSLDEEDADTPAWSRGRPPGTGTKRRATRASEMAVEGDEVANFEDELQPELEEIGVRKRQRRLRAHEEHVVVTTARPTTRRSTRRASAPALVDRENPFGSGEDNEVDEDDHMNETGNYGGTRYPSRRRSRVDYFDPEVVYQTRPRPKHKPQEVQSSEEEEEGEGEDEEEEEGEGEEAGPSHRYPLRDRALVTLQPTPPKETAPHAARGGAGRSRRLGFGGSRRGSRQPSSYHLDEDTLDPDADWAAMNAAERGSREDQGKKKAPWETALGEAAVLDKRTDASKNTEITPVQVDESVDFNQVGGLNQYIKALKEMVFLPLVYPELFERFHIAPPKGVLFYGPPGTGKTLVARALASHASRAGKKVSFFMRKGADVLSKWVGEAERQLRLLFEEAQKNQPAIIFFDEIDGLAPVRSSKQDQIHNSIVSTLLALMDGLDSRGQVVLIGATNRIDSLDSALRRPGRFDRELVFPLPNNKARASILEIHTRKWAQPPAEDLRLHLADMCVGYCGADLKALCTEACLKALRRKYPQIYESEQKLLVDPGAVSVEKEDFLSAFNGIVPASHRSAAAYSRPLADNIKPALEPVLSSLLHQLCTSFPPAAALDLEGNGIEQNCTGVELDARDSELGASLVMRPRLLLCGPEEAGQSHLSAALLHALEGLQVHAIGLPSLLSDASARSPEEALVHTVVEARRSAPSILYLPHLTLWWETAPRSLQATLWMLLADLPPNLPLLLLASADAPLADIPDEALALFGNASQGQGFAHELHAPDIDQRKAMFRRVCEDIAGPVHQKPAAIELSPPPMLPVAPEGLEAAQAASKEEEAAELRRQWEDDDSALRSLRMVLRNITTNLLCNRQWKEFWEPANPEMDPEYYERVKAPMDLGTMLCRVDNQHYPTAEHYRADLSLISKAAKEYWEDDPQGLPEISRAKAMEDQTCERLLARLPADIRRKCEAIHAKGGPAPPPPGLELPQGMPSTSPTNQQPVSKANHTAWRADAATGRTRLRGRQVDDSLVFQDPEAIMRAKRQEQRKAKETRGSTPPPESLLGEDASKTRGQGDADAPMMSKAADSAPHSHVQEQLPEPVETEDHGQAGNERGTTQANEVPVVLEGEELQVLQEIPEENPIVPDSDAPQTKAKRVSKGSGFRAALDSFRTSLASDLFTPATALKPAGRPNSNLLFGESTADQTDHREKSKEQSRQADVRGVLAEETPIHTEAIHVNGCQPYNIPQDSDNQATGQAMESSRQEQAQTPILLDHTEKQTPADPIIASGSSPAQQPLQPSADTANHHIRVAALLDKVVMKTDNWLIGALEDLHCRLARIAWQFRYNADRNAGIAGARAALPVSE